MKFAHFFIDRPVFASVLSILTVIVGALAIYDLPVAQYPEIAPPTVVVTANFPGANARTVSDTIAAPIEQQINGVENMLYMSSQSTNDGQLRLTVTFKLGTDLDTAQVQVQNRVAIAEPALPEETRRLGVQVRKSSPDITLVVQFFSPDKSRDTLYISNFATLQVRDQIARLPGVGDVFLFGARDYAMRVWLDPQKLASLNMTAGDVVRAIREQNVQVAAGVVGAPPLPPANPNPLQLTVNAQGRLTTEEEFGAIVVRTGERGAITRVRDVARVERGARDYAVTAYADGQESIAMPVFQLPGSNALETRDAVAERMEELSARADWPAGVAWRIPYDTTVFVRQSMYDVLRTLVEAVLLVVVVVVVFLQSWRASVIPLAAVPVSLIGTCAVMWAMGFSLNNLSMFGLVLAIGIVVDDAIVVVENVERWIARGFAPREATYRAMTEVTPAVIAVAAGLSAVFIPTAFITGISGQFYKQFALTIAVSTLISAFNSLTLSPALAALLLRPHGARPDRLTRVINVVLGWFFRLFNRTLELGTGAYVGALRRLTRVAALVMVAYVGLLALTYLGFRAVPTGFIPTQDKGYVIANLQMPDAASIQRTDATIRRMAEIAHRTPGVKYTFAIAGFSALSFTNQSNAAAMFVTLEDFDKRAGDPSMTSEAIIGRLMAEYGQIQDGFALVFPPPAVTGMGIAGGFKMQVQDRSGRTPEELQAVTEQVIAAVSQDPRVRGVLTSFRASVPQLWAQIDREKVKTLNVAVTDVFEALQVFLGSVYVNDFNFLGRTYQVTAQADAPFRATPGDIARLETRNAAGRMVPLGSVLEIKDITGPVRIGRYNLYPTAEIQGAGVPGVASSEVNALIERAANENLPQGFGFEWTELTYQENLANVRVFGVPMTMVIFGMCVLFVFLVHAAEYESWSLPTAIIMIVPMCLLAAIGGVMLRGMDNNIFTQIGFVVLAGLSAKNAVLIVEFAKQQEEHHPGIGATRAAIEAARLRLRPILMTSLAFILGVLPLVIAEGAGFEMRQALGTTVFFGMIGVTLFGIFLTPVFYVSIRWLTTKLGFGPPAHPPAGVPAGRGDAVVEAATGGGGADNGQAFCAGNQVVPAPAEATLRLPEHPPTPPVGDH
jgi:hydrophobe/amphiphile efflux-1 (HAE1) family protein